MMDYEQPHQELVKCVLVGDTAVGKTRLVCARACNKHVSLSQLMTTHVPTVWAIDQYRIYKDVLERSWEVVDGVNVSLRLWDTFGDHEKDRRFAYGRSDVVILCFSITNPVSLKNCLAMWYPEIRRFCPQTPILLVGCKSDLRYMYRDQAYLNFFKDRSPFLRLTRKSDLVMPDEARAVARELGIQYYETSVLTYYGVNEAFENAIRAALLARRHQRFWITNLRKVQRPLLQAPYLPPKPKPPEVFVLGSSYDDNFKSLWLNPVYTDTVLIACNVAFAAHRLLLAAASPAFLRVFTSETLEFGGRSSSDSSMASTMGEASLADFNDETECLLRADARTLRVWDQLKRRSSCQVIPSCRKVGVVRELNHPAFESVCVKQCSEMDARTNTIQTIITFTKIVTPLALNQCLQYVYTGTLSTMSSTTLVEIRQAAEFLELRELMAFVSNIQSREEFLNTDIKYKYKKLIKERILELCIHQGQFSDVLFHLDDGCFVAHRPLLVARCDVMKAMFSGDFRESAAKVVRFILYALESEGQQVFQRKLRPKVLIQLMQPPKIIAAFSIYDVPPTFIVKEKIQVLKVPLSFWCYVLPVGNRHDTEAPHIFQVMFPGVGEDTFLMLLQYLYTDDIGSVSPARSIHLLELANRLCLPRLVNLTEQRVVTQLSNMTTDQVLEHCLQLLEPSQLHNAHQLADWCMNYLCTNYNKLCKNSWKLVRMLQPDNQEYLKENRWPPVWYLKDYDNFEKCLGERQAEDRKLLKRGRTGSGCLCFFNSKSSKQVNGSGRESLLEVPSGAVVVAVAVA